MRGDRNKSSFDDLIDIAVKAVKDGVIAAIEFHNDLLVIFVSKSAYVHATPSFTASKSTNTSYISEVISKIDSLYVESFEIEDISCLLKINENIQSLVLANGCDVTDQIYFEDCGMHLKDGYGNSIVPNINILKGATVTQKKVNN